MKYFISVGDASADLHAAKLISAIRRLEPEAEFIGLGGPEMIKAGFRSLIPLNRISVIGFWEVVKHFRTFLDLKKKCSEILKSNKIDALIAVDYPGFNINLAASARTLGIPVLYYIAPQLWAWGANRAKKLARVVDKLFVVFPFEEEYFRKFGINTEFVGHPLLDNPVLNEEFIPIENRERRIMLLPGSRSQEIHRHLPILVETVKILKDKLPDFEFTIAKSKAVNIREIEKYTVRTPYINIRDNARELMRRSRAGIVKSGTSNLEAALAGMPFSLVYTISKMTYFIGKRIINLDWISIVNILKNENVIKEFIQSDASPEAIASDILDLSVNSGRTDKMLKDFDSIRKMLGGGGASDRAAAEILKYLKN